MQISPQFPWSHNLPVEGLNVLKTICEVEKYYECILFKLFGIESTHVHNVHGGVNLDYVSNFPVLDVEYNQIIFKIMKTSMKGTKI